MAMCPGGGVGRGGGRRIPRPVRQAGRRRESSCTIRPAVDGSQVSPGVTGSLFVFQDMQISAVELQTILNKIVCKRKSAPSRPLTWSPDRL